MNTNLNVRKPIVLTLAALAFVLVASVLLVSLLHAASGANEMGARVSPNPRVRFAPLDGYSSPATLDGKRSPATLDGLKPLAALDGKRSPATLDGRKPPATLEFRKPPTALGGRKPPPGALSNLQVAPLTLVDGLILLGLAILLLVPAQKANLSHS